MVNESIVCAAQQPNTTQFHHNIAKRALTKKNILHCNHVNISSCQNASSLLQFRCIYRQGMDDRPRAYPESDELNPVLHNSWCKRPDISHLHRPETSAAASQNGPTQILPSCRGARGGRQQQQHPLSKSTTLGTAVPA